MNDTEILVTVLRWYATHQRRLAACHLLYESKKAEKQSMSRLSSAYRLSLNVTEAKRVERAALRALAKVCMKVRGKQQNCWEDAAIVLPTNLLGNDLCDTPTKQVLEIGKASPSKQSHWAGATNALTRGPNSIQTPETLRLVGPTTPGGHQKWTGWRDETVLSPSIYC
jgi:hypothetical protein